MLAYMNLLGLKVEDRVTKFRGVVTSISHDLYGCVQAVVTPEADKKKLEGGAWFDCNRLKVMSDKPVMPVPSYEAMRPGMEIGAADKPARDR